MSAQMKICPRCKSRAELPQQVCAECGHQFRTQFQPPPDDRTRMEWGIAQPFLPEEPIQYGPPPRRTDLCAVLAFGFGVLGLLAFPILFGPPAFLLGFVGAWRIRENRQQLKGHSYALVGVCLGIVNTLIGAWALRSLAAQPPPPPEVVTVESVQPPPTPSPAPGYSPPTLPGWNPTPEERQRINAEIDRKLEELQKGPPPRARMPVTDPNQPPLAPRGLDGFAQPL